MKRKRKSLCSDKKETCAICFEEKKIKNLTGLNNCTHLYCLECILEWSKKENSCPQCKKKFTLLKIPGRKKRKRIENRDLKNDNNSNDINMQDRIISTAVMNYVTSYRFRDYLAQAILRTNDIRATILWQIIQRALPILNRQIRSDILENNENISDVSLDILEATDAMMRLRNAFSRIINL